MMRNKSLALALSAILLLGTAAAVSAGDDPPPPPKPFQGQPTPLPPPQRGVVVNNAQEATPAPTAMGSEMPEAAVPEMVFDAGDVTRGDTIKHDFVIENKGKGVLEITRVQPACGCTVTQFDKSVAPGQSGKITASVSTVAFTGPIHKTISVITNDSKLGSFQLAVKATVKSIVKVDPNENQNFGLVFSGQPSEKTFTITAEDGAPFEITSIQAEDPNLVYDLSKTADKKGYVFKVTLPADHPAGPINGRFTVSTTHPKVPTLNLNVFGTIRDPLTLYPPQVLFSGLNREYVNSHPDDIALNKTITVAFEMAPELTIEKVTSSLPNLTSEVQTITPNQRYSIKLKLNPPVKVGDFEGTVTIVTNKKTVTVPVKGKIF